MKETTVSKEEWRTVQFFLSARGVFEVEIDLESDGVRCTCPGFQSRNVCKHSRIVVKKADENRGVYPLQISAKASANETKHATDSNESFREFVVKYGKIEVI